MPKKSFLRRNRTWIVWALRILVGSTFIFSGFAKAVDPWGFMYKMEDYLMAWSVDWAPSSILFIGAITIAGFEFCAGLMLLLGCMRRISVYSLTALMCVMLPLTAYIWIASPVADCGCFGDALVLSNGATFAKNVVLMAFLLILIPRNMLVKGLIRPLYQWLPLSAAILYCLVISLLGYMVQPLVDFRPYKEGLPLLAEEDDDDAEILMVYEKDGVEKEFALDALPDSTWTFVRRATEYAIDKRQIAIYDEGEEMTEVVIADEGPQMLLIVPDPRKQGRARSSLANRMYDFMGENGGEMIGLVPLSGDNLQMWKKLTLAEYPIYTVEATVLKEIARGDAALVMLEDGVVKWKRNIYSLPADYPLGISSIEELNEMSYIDNRKVVIDLSIILLALIALAAGMDNALKLVARKKS